MSQTLRLLLVEDAEDDAALLMREVRKGGDDCVFRRVESAAGMRAALAEAPWDLIFSDFSMPHFTGLDALEILRESGLDIPLIVVSGAIGEETAVELMRAGASDFISKDKLGRIVPVMRRELADVEMRRQRQAALREAEVANRAKREFLANMSHEIRTPITGIVGAIDLLRYEELSPVQTELFDLIVSSANSLVTLIDDILDLSTIEVGQLAVERREFSLRDCLDEVIAVQRGRLQAKELAFSLEIDDDVPDCLVGDPLRLKQIVFNLLGNAVKFTQHGGVAIAVKARCREDERCAVQIVVADTGIGIAPDAQERIFKLFEQGDGSITRRFGGAGLGLSLCQRLVELLGGRIDVESRIDEGSAFTLTLPFELKRAAESVATSEALELQGEKRGRGTGLRVLLAEDSKVNQLIISKFLKKLGHKVVLAEDGSRALSLLENEGPFSLVLMDIMMPIMNGLDALAQIRTREAGQGEHLPVVAITAHAQAGDRERYLSAGFDGYIAKPLKIDDLVACIAQTCSPSAGSAQLH